MSLEYGNRNVTIRFDDIRTTPTAGISLKNQSVATGTYTVQSSPSILFQSAAWDTDGSNFPSYWRVYSSPVSGSTPNHNLLIDYSTNGSTFTNVISILNGYVGINKAVPTKALDVVGEIYATSNITSTFLVQCQRANTTTPQTTGISCAASSQATSTYYERTSPAIGFLSRIWCTSGAGSSKVNAMAIRCRGVSGEVTSGALLFETQYVDDVLTEIECMRLTSDGVLTLKQKGHILYEHFVKYIQQTTKTITNTTAETSCFSDTNAIGSRTIPANMARAGMTIRVSLKFLLSSTANPTNTINITIGSVTIYNVAATLGAGHSNDYAECTFDITFRSIGATGTIVAIGRTLVTGTSDISRAIILSTPATLDTTIDNTIDVKYTWGAASASNILSTISSTIEILN